MPVVEGYGLMLLDDCLLLLGGLGLICVLGSFSEVLEMVIEMMAEIVVLGCFGLIDLYFELKLFIELIVQI